jgi:DNA-binding winged helix-turn-helix (wHTH) protein
VTKDQLMSEVWEGAVVEETNLTTNVSHLRKALGEKERAIEQLGKAYEVRAGWIINLKVEPLFDPLRSDPRFADIMRRVGLPR